MKKHKGIRIIISIAGIAGLILFLIPLVAMRILNIGNITGIAVFLSLTFYGIWMPQVHGFVGRCWKHTAGKILLCVLEMLAGVVLVLAVSASSCMLRAALQKPEEGATVVVLGCKVNAERASQMLNERLQAAYDYLEANPEAVCILSGGQGKGEDISEARCMYNDLVKRGIDPERLYQEEESTSTRENMAFSKKIIDAQGMNAEVAIVTNEFHEYRAAEIAGKLGLSASAVPGKTAWWLFPTFYVRELYGIIYEWVL